MPSACPRRLDSAFSKTPIEGAGVISKSEDRSMQYDNDAKQLKYQVLTQVAKYTFEGTLDKHIEEIPYDIIPGPVPNFRCCIYREREIIRERITSAQGAVCRARRNAALSAFCRLPARAAPSAALRLQITARNVWRKNARRPARLARFLSPAGRIHRPGQM